MEKQNIKKHPKLMQFTHMDTDHQMTVMGGIMAQRLPFSYLIEVMTKIDKQPFEINMHRSANN